MKVENLFEIADKAKDIGEYEIANDCFAVISVYVIENREGEFYYEYSNADVVASLYSPMREGYYDLVAVRIERDYLCIPFPLLSVQFINKVLSKNLITFIPRLEHRREHIEFGDGQRTEMVADLRRRLAEEVDEETISRCREMCLFVDEEVVESDFE